MNLRSAIIISAVLLFVSAPAWGDSLKFKHDASPNAIRFTNDAPKSGHSDIKFLSGFNSENNGNHFGFFKSRQGRCILNPPSGKSDSPSVPGGGGDPVSTAEPTSLLLLLIGLIGFGALVVRRNPSMVGAQ
jgi:hypothetical protein